ncbi:MAG: hypothetical protein ACF8R9_06280 [Phycisphaerales bacterium JB054]
MSANPCRLILHPNLPWMIASVTLFAAAMLGCERREIEEHTVAKGVERVPEAPPESPVAAGQPGADAEAASRPWTVPDGWTEDTEPRPMRLATYLAPDADGAVEVAVTRFAGRVGGELANINRWRGQMGLPALDEAGLEAAIVRFASSGYDGYQTRIESAGGVMLAAGVYDEAIDQTWFLRATLADAASADRLESDLFAMARSIAGVAREDGG